jgi:hypothetical protein
MSDERCTGLLARLGRELGVAGLAFDAGTGTCALVFERRITVHVAAERGDEAMLLFSTLGGLDPRQQPELVATVLRGNYLWRGTAGATLSMDPVHDVALLAQRLPVDGLTAATLEQRLGNFVEAALAWMQRLAESPRAPA